MMSGWERCAKARFSRMMGIPNGAGCRKFFLSINSRASAVNETCFYLASRRVGIIGTAAFESMYLFRMESMQVFRAFLFRKRVSRPKPLLSAVFRARRGCPFAGGVRLRQKVWADLWLDGGKYPSGLVPETDECLSEVLRLGERYFQDGAAKGEAIPAARVTGFQGRPLPYNRRYGSEQAAGDTVAMMPMESK